MSTLFVSDLDGTLLQPDARLSATTVEILNRELRKGTLFTVATARTPATVAPILQDVDMRLPAIVMTGAALWDAATRLYSRVIYMEEQSARELVARYREINFPIFIYTLHNQLIHIYHNGCTLSPLENSFLEERVHNSFKCVEISEAQAERLPDDYTKVVLCYGMQPDATARAAYEATRDIPGIRPQFYHDIFGPEVGIVEAFSADATKAKAMRALASEIGADKIVCFGDNINDLPMMREADLAVAVENALPEVKEAADIVIGPNTADSVAKFIADHAD